MFHLWCWYVNCLSLLGTLRSEEGFTINNIVYEDVDKLSGPVTYDPYETAPEVPVSSGMHFFFTSMFL